MSPTSFLSQTWDQNPGQKQQHVSTKGGGNRCQPVCYVNSGTHLHQRNTCMRARARTPSLSFCDKHTNPQPHWSEAKGGWMLSAAGLSGGATKQGTPQGKVWWYFFFFSLSPNPMKRLKPTMNWSYKITLPDTSPCHRATSLPKEKNHLIVACFYLFIYCGYLLLGHCWK